MAEAGRVIAGIAAGRHLLAPGPGTRPFADRVKQTLFAILEPDLPGAAVLDLFAGSGAAGIEALSRGAATATFVERDGGAVRTIRENLRRTGLDGPTAVVAQADVLAWLGRRVAVAVAEEAAAVGGAGTADEPDRGAADATATASAAIPFRIVIVDPPYAETDLLVAVLARLGDESTGLVEPDGRVVAKHFWRSTPPEQVGLLAAERVRRFGETALTFYRAAEVIGP